MRFGRKLRNIEQNYGIPHKYYQLRTYYSLSSTPDLIRRAASSAFIFIFNQKSRSRELSQPRIWCLRVLMIHSFFCSFYPDNFKLVWKVPVALLERKKRNAFTAKNWGWEPWFLKPFLSGMERLFSKASVVGKMISCSDSNGGSNFWGQFQLRRYHPIITVIIMVMIAVHTSKNIAYLVVIVPTKALFISKNENCSKMSAALLLSLSWW